MSFPVDLARIREVLLPLPVATDFIQEAGGQDIPEQTLTSAAILFPIVLRGEEPTLLLTQRTAHLKDHAGQISFPGGRVEPEDSSRAVTALRETREEIGLTEEAIRIIGYLPEYRTGTGFRVTPVVAEITPPFVLQPDTFEVAEVFEVPLGFVINPANHRLHQIHYRGADRTYFAMPYQNRFIWGATAGMIRSLSDRLGLLNP